MQTTSSLSDRYSPVYSRPQLPELSEIPGVMADRWKEYDEAMQRYTEAKPW